MGKGYLYALVMLGVFGAMMSNMRASPPPASATPERAFQEYSARKPESPAPQPAAGEIRLERAEDGHFYADVQVNGMTLHVLVDTGASGIALTRDDARRAGLATSAGMSEVVGEGASGEVLGEYVTLDRVSLGGVEATDLDAVVLDTGQQSLLGQNFLRQFAAVEIRGDTMLLR